MSRPFAKFHVEPSKYSIGEFTVGVFPTAHCDTKELAGSAKDLHEAQQKFVADAIAEKMERERPASEGRL